MSALEKCCCTGLRYCKTCIGSERVKGIIEGRVNVRTPEEVIFNQFTQGRTSSCSFLQLGPSSFSLCPDCGVIFTSSHLVKMCSDHYSLPVSNMQIEGFFIERDGVTEDQERVLLEGLDRNCMWKDSQSGRRKLEYGPKKNFKKKKLKLSEDPGMPMVLEFLFDLVSKFAVEKTKRSFSIAEANILDYSEDRFSGFDPHVDDTWLWGERIIGVNLLSDVIFTLVNSEGVPVSAMLPRRCFFMLSGKSRYEWMHGLDPLNVKGRRVSITLRELSDEILLQDPQTCEAILQSAKAFV